jgi:bifunctional N-acetylglucosamine-1-phosphate-uridyltransferase/glucosamine-1-phosphate-acetyltransferase GlmU-like protein
MVTASLDSLCRLLQYAVTVSDVPEADVIRQFASGPLHREQWTAVIPAAGQGASLGFDLPKILYPPVAGRTILEWLARLLGPVCAGVIVVASPEGAPVISRRLDQLLPGRSEVAVQAEPRGMADAIQAAPPQLRTTHALIVWGDQAALKPESLDVCASARERRSARYRAYADAAQALYSFRA